MESQPRPYVPCARHTGNVAIACELVRLLTHHEIRYTEPDTSSDDLMAQRTATITKSVVTLGVLGCGKNEEALINELTE